MNALAWPEADRVDRERMARGLVYCPVCRRPTHSPAGIVDAIYRLARHLEHAHDPTFAALIRGAMIGAARAAAAE